MVFDRDGFIQYGLLRLNRVNIQVESWTGAYILTIYQWGQKKSWQNKYIYSLDSYHGKLLWKLNVALFVWARFLNSPSLMSALNLLLLYIEFPMWFILKKSIHCTKRRQINIIWNSKTFEWPGAILTYKIEIVSHQSNCNSGSWFL